LGIDFPEESISEIVHAVIFLTAREKASEGELAMYETA
jgi:hypothetical protein